jgi:4-amino-4-deoxy-L-arabinose transferase-like glycosyltransferase
MDPTATIFLIGGIMLLALALRLPSLGDSLAGDELATNFVVHGFGVGNVLWIVRHGKEATPPLFFLLTWLTKGFGGNGGLRLVSLLAGLATIPVTYLVGVRTVGQAAAMVGAALVALSPFQIAYATQARAYSLMMLFCILACLALLVALESGGVAWWVAYGLFVAAALYTHYTSIFVLAVLFGWAFITRPEARRALIAANLGAVLLFSPWVPQFLDDTGKQAAKNIESFDPLTLATAKNHVLELYFGHPAVGVGEIPGRLALWLIAAAGALGITSLVLTVWRTGSRWWPPPTGVALVIALAVAAPVGAALHNIVAPSLFEPRNLISSWPGFALAVGALVTAGREPIRWAAVALVLAGFALGGAKMLDRDNQGPDYDAAADFIERTGDPGSPVVDVPTNTPGPQTGMEAALASEGAPLPGNRQVLELGFPTFEQRLDLNRRGLSLFEPVPYPSEQEIARRAAQLAGNGTLFVVDGSARLDQVREFPSAFERFLAALPPRFHEVAWRVFPGISNNVVGVHVLSGRSVSPPRA